MLKLLVKLKTNDSGATAIEYGLIAGLISIVIITGATLIGADLQSLFQTVADGVGAAEGENNAVTAGGG